MLVLLLVASAETILLVPFGNARVEQEVERALSERGTAVTVAKKDEAKKCEGRTACLAALGKHKAQKVLVGKSLGNTVQFTLLTVEGVVVQTASLTFGDPAKVVKEGIARVVPMEEEPALQAVTPLKKKTVAPTAPLPQVTYAAKPAEPPPRQRTMLYAGIVLASIGVAGMGAGLGLWLNAQAIAATVTPTTPQTPTVERERSANLNVVGANIGYIAGGVLLGAGAALIIADIILHRRLQPKLSLGTVGMAF